MNGLEILCARLTDGAQLASGGTTAWLFALSVAALSLGVGMAATSGGGSSGDEPASGTPAATTPGAPPPPPPDADPATRDRYWLEHVYRGDTVPQLTVRSIILGMILGAVMSFSNLYVGLKIGWGLGVAITSSIIAFAVMRALKGLSPSEFTILENNTMASCASAAGYMSSAGLVSAIPALDMMIRDNSAAAAAGTAPLDPGLQALKMSNVGMILWLTAISVLGVIMAVPLKRQMINIEQLKFPSGIAAAETLRSMYSAGSDAIKKARSLAFAGLAGAFAKFVLEGKGLERVPALPANPTRWQRISNGIQKLFAFKQWTAPEIITLPVTVKGFPLSSYALGLPSSPLMIAAGAIIGIRIGIALLIGAIINYAVLLPWLVGQGVFEQVVPGVTRAAIEARHHIPYRVPPHGPVPLFALMRGKWSVWPGTSLMVTAGLLSFAFRWRMIVRAFTSVIDRFRKREPGAVATDDPLAHIEVPSSWFVTGFVLAGVATVLLQTTLFGIKWWIGIAAVLLTFVLSMVAARATGETDITPIGAMGKITQLAFGGFAPTQPAVNLMTANVTAGAASHSADLLTDVKAGYLLGGNPRKQFIAQMFGVLAGAIACVPVYRLIARPETLGESIPAPAAQTWRSVAELLTKGIAALPQYALTAMIVGGVAGVIIAALEEFLPKHKKWLPSPTGLGIALVIDAKDSIAMFLGALIAWMIAKRWPKKDEMYTVAVSSGWIAGESLMGVLLAILTVAGFMAS